MYGMSRYPELSPADQIERALDHLYDKYGADGLSSTVDSLERKCVETSRTAYPAGRSQGR